VRERSKRPAFGVIGVKLGRVSEKGWKKRTIETRRGKDSQRKDFFEYHLKKSRLMASRGG